MMADCPVCLQVNAHILTPDVRYDREQVQCARCGTYLVTRPAKLSIGWLTEDGAKRHLLSGIIRKNFERGATLILTAENIPELLAAARPPRDPFEAIDLLLLHLFDRAESPASAVQIFPNADYPLVYARNQDEFAHYVAKAEGLGYIQRQNYGADLLLDLKGWERVRELRQTRTISDQAFVAMWFAPEMLDAWHEGIKPALTATGYRPVRLDMEEHNDKVDDRIIAEIRRSGLVVADFSGDRSNVYFEAGFALGLGIPVIWTCRESDVRNLHFDTRQYNYIAWSDPADLRAKLQLRIEATIPNHPGARRVS